MSETDRLYNESAIELRSSSALDDTFDIEKVQHCAGAKDNRIRSSFLYRWLITMLRIVVVIWTFAIPTFLRTKHQGYRPMGHIRDPAQAALDGLRGIACFIVAIYHFLLCMFNESSLIYGYTMDESLPGGGVRSSFWHWPVVRIVYAGPGMVSVFFVISGYVLSHRTLTLCQQGRMEVALMGLSSSAFRRWIRLFLPFLAMNIIIQVALRLQMFELSRLFMIRHRVEVPVRGDDLYGQAWLFWEWCGKVADMTFFWSRDWTCVFDCNHWTIPVEFRCSMVLFLCLVALTRVKVWLRLLAFGVVGGIALHAHLWELVLFLIGAAIAQANIVFSAKRTVGASTEHLSKSRRPWLWLPCAAMAFYLSSAPRNPEGSGGYRSISQYDPFAAAYIFNTWTTLGAALMVILATNCATGIELLNWAPVQYLGHISYGLYLIHGSIIRVGYGYFNRLYDSMREDAEAYDHRAFLVSGLLCFVVFFIPSIIVLSDMFTRGIDEPTVKLARRMLNYGATSSK